MSLLRSRKLLDAIILIGIVFPQVSPSQVKIKERMEIRSRSSVPPRTSAGPYDYFSPPLFIDDEGTPVVPLAATLTASGKVTIVGTTDPGNSAEVGYAVYNQRAIAWMYRQGDNYVQGDSPFTDELQYGQEMPAIADIYLKLYDGDNDPEFWKEGNRTITITDERLSYEFTGKLHNISDNTYSDVNGSASLIGQFDNWPKFSGWGCSAAPLTATGHDSVDVIVTPLNNNGSPYGPVGVSSDGIEITVSVAVHGNYAYLSGFACDANGSPIERTYESGMALTMPMSSVFFLVYDESKGTFDGATDTVMVTVTGGTQSVTIPVTLVKYDLLLGQSRYYYVAYNSSGPEATAMKGKNTPSLAKVTGSYMIMSDGDPAHPSPNMITDVNYNVSPLIEGDTLGVYYETHEVRSEIPQGMIRLVGRYWREGNDHPVRLESDWTEVQVKVKKPDVLGRPDIDDRDRHTLITDVRGNDLWLDEFIYKYAGENGIPPQIMKGQIETETSFTPAWRYEPIMDLNTQKNHFNDYFAPDLPFNVRNGIDNDLPESHTHVSPSPYVKEPTTIGNYTVKYWAERFVREGKGAAPDSIIASIRLDRLWKVIYWATTYCMDPLGIAVPVEGLKSFVHDIVKGRILDGTFDKDFSKTAQTRKVTSYGFVQMMYISAVDGRWRETAGKYGVFGHSYVDKRSNAEYPEKLNEQEFLFPRYSDFTLFDLRTAFTEAFTGKMITPKNRARADLESEIPQSEWPTGYDAVWTRAMKWHNYSAKDYSKNVMQSAGSYSPHYNK